MGRSNTAPISHSHRKESGSTKIPHRSATVKSPGTASSRTSHLPHLKLPHLPFHHHDEASPNISTPSAPPRPQGGLNRQNSVHTRYMAMLLAQDTIPRLHNILISFFTWILLAGFLVFPGTFTTLRKLDENPDLKDNEAAQAILKGVKNVQLLYIAGACCGIGAGGMLWLWWRWRENFVWLLNRIFLPGCLNSFAGLISTLINVYSQQKGVWSTSAWVTAAVTGGCMVITGLFFVLYNFWLLEKVRRKHGREMEAQGEEGLIEKVERKAHEPGLEPGSVV